MVVQPVSLHPQRDVAELTSRLRKEKRVAQAIPSSVLARWNPSAARERRSPTGGVGDGDQAAAPSRSASVRPRDTAFGRLRPITESARGPAKRASARGAVRNGSPSCPSIEPCASPQGRIFDGFSREWTRFGYLRDLELVPPGPAYGACLIARRIVLQRPRRRIGTTPAKTRTTVSARRLRVDPYENRRGILQGLARR